MKKNEKKKDNIKLYVTLYIISTININNMKLTFEKKNSELLDSEIIIKQKSKGFFKKPGDSDSDSDSDSESELKSNEKIQITFNSDSDLESKNIKNLLKTPKAIKNSKKNKDYKLIDTNNNDDSFLTLNSFQYQHNIIDDSIFENIHIRCCQRNSRKTITTIEGICSVFFNDSNKVENLLKNLRRGTRATYKYDKISGHIIEISGNKVDNMIESLCKYVGCDHSQIIVHGIIN
jgi:translation initiation factor 1 (eIF-1/SUI1)